MQSISLKYKGELTSDSYNKRIHELIGGNVVLKGYNINPIAGTLSVNLTGAADNESVLFINGAKIKETSAIIQSVSFAANNSGSNRSDTIYAYYENGVSSICEYRVVQGATESPSPTYSCKIATVVIPNGATSISAGNITLGNNRIFDILNLSRPASSTEIGLFTPSLFDKLTGIQNNANNYTHPITSGNKHIPAGGSAGQLIGWDSDGTPKWVNAPVTYTHPANHDASIITQSASYRFVTDAEKSSWNSKAEGSHGNHVPTVQAANNAVFLRNDNTWASVTPSNIGAAAASHGNHVPALQGANNAVFLRNDNTWATVTPANIGAAAVSHSHSYLPLSGGTISGNLTVTGTIQGAKVYNAVWNDYAELFRKDDLEESFNVGDIIELNPNTGNYRKSTKRNSTLVVGVISDQYGHLLGGEYGLSEEENLKTHVAVGLAGRLMVNVIGSVKAGDLISSSDIPGVGITAEHYSPGCIIGKALENKKDTDIGKIKILIINR